jgi:hypothetical protein
MNVALNISVDEDSFPHWVRAKIGDEESLTLSAEEALILGQTLMIAGQRAMRLDAPTRMSTPKGDRA